MYESIGKVIFVIGIIMMVAGAFLMVFKNVPLPGKLPGDIFIQKKNFSFYFPLTSSLLVSIIVSVILYLFSRR